MPIYEKKRKNVFFELVASAIAPSIGDNKKTIISAIDCVYPQYAVDVVADRPVHATFAKKRGMIAVNIIVANGVIAQS